LRTSSFDLSVFFSKFKFEEVLLFWFIDYYFFFRLLQHCFVNRISFFPMYNLLGHYLFLAGINPNVRVLCHEASSKLNWNMPVSLTKDTEFIVVVCLMLLQWLSNILVMFVFI
jgi:hypothetical protein